MEAEKPAAANPGEQKVPLAVLIVLIVGLVIGGMYMMSQLDDSINGLNQSVNTAEEARGK